MGRCAAMALAAARMAVADAEIASAQALAGPRTAVVIGTTMGEALGSSPRWNTSGSSTGPQAVTRALIPQYGSTPLPIHVARAVGAQGHGARPARRLRGGQLRHQVRRRPHPRGARRRRGHGRRGAPSGAAVQRLRAPGRHGPERCQPSTSTVRDCCSAKARACSSSRARPRAAPRRRPQAEVGGYGLSCDAYHITRPHPDAAGSITAMRARDRGSGLTPTDVDFVNAHGTGTHANDARRGEGHARRLRRPARPHLEHEEHARPLHGRRKRARGHRLRLDASRRAFTRRPSATRRPTRSAISTSWPTSRAAARPTSCSTTRWPSAATTRSRCFARPGVLPAAAQGPARAARRRSP